MTLYHYHAIVTKVYDGDTVTLDIDLGLYTWVKGVKARLYGIDAPELRGEERPHGLASRDWLRLQVLDKEVVIETIKDKQGKYGRWLCKIWLDGRDIIAEMVEAGLAEWRDYD